MIPLKDRPCKRAKDHYGKFFLMHLNPGGRPRSFRPKTIFGTTLPFFLCALISAPSVFSQEVVAAPPSATHLWDFAVSGGIMMIPLAALSVIAVMLILVYMVTLRRGAVVTGRYMQTAEALIRKRDDLGLLAISNRHNEAVARIIQRTLDFTTKNPRATHAQAREIAQAEGMRLAGAMSQQISYLADIGTIAPMLGLFGTVLGLIKSFTAVASDIAASRPTLLAHGVSEALVATAAGLLVGIPAMAAYSFFRGRVQARISDLEAATTQLMALLSVGSSGRPE